MTRKSICVASAIAFLVLAGPASAALFVSTGQTGAQVQCDINHTRFWTYTVTADVNDVDGALFNMKIGSGTVEDITFSIFEGTFDDYGTAPSLLELTLTPASFTQSFDWIPFQTTAINLQAGVTYTGVLASDALDPQESAYFIKEDVLKFVDEYGVDVTPDGGGEITTEDTNMPEPISLALFALASLMMPRRRR